MNACRSLVLLLCCAALGSCAQTRAPAPEPESARLAQELRAVTVDPGSACVAGRCQLATPLGAR